MKKKRGWNMRGWKNRIDTQPEEKYWYPLTAWLKPEKLRSCLEHFKGNDRQEVCLRTAPWRGEGNENEFAIWTTGKHVEGSIKKVLIRRYWRGKLCLSGTKVVVISDSQKEKK